MRKSPKEKSPRRKIVLKEKNPIGIKVLGEKSPKEKSKNAQKEKFLLYNVL